MKDILEIKNGEQVKGTFSPQEMQSRLSKLRKMMAEKEIDAILFTSYHNINYSRIQLRSATLSNIKQLKPFW